MTVGIIFWAIIGTAIGLLFGFVKVLFSRVNDRPEEWEVKEWIRSSDTIRPFEDALAERCCEQAEDIKKLKDDYYTIIANVNELRNSIYLNESKEAFLKEHLGEPLTEEMFDEIRGKDK